MSKNLLRNVWIVNVWIVIILASCAPASRNSISRDNGNNSSTGRQPGAPGFEDVDAANIVQNEFLADKKPLSLMELPRTEEGAFVLSPGYYEADFKSYCLQPGTPDPSARDAYFQAPLRHHRKDIIETILRNSQQKSYLEQRNIQLLLWSVVSGSDYNKLSPAVQSTARQLLSSKQLFELKGGVMGVVKTVATMLPATGLTTAHNDLQKLFELGTSSYEIYERVAVLRQPSEIRRPDFKKDQWYRQEEGYYARYFPNGYQNVKIQVYVPEGSIDTSRQASGDYMIFDPTSMVIMPANSNAQRLGIGGPVLDIVRLVIKIGSRNAKKQPGNKPTNPPTNPTNKNGKPL